MSLLLYASALFSLFGTSVAPIQINVDAKSGDVVSGERTFKVTVDAGGTTAINQVEFYVGNDLRDTETSTPYLFPMDTLSESDGDLKLRFKAYTSSNQQAEKVITIHVDNEIGKGAPYHIQKGTDALTNSQWQTAFDQGRIALKIDSQSNQARLVMSRANLGMRAYDKAQKYAEDALSQDAKDDAALQLLAGIKLHEAFNTYAKQGSDKADITNTIGDDFKSAVEYRKKSLDLEVDKVGPPTDKNLIVYADATLRAGRYSLTIDALTPALGHDMTAVPIINRLAYAQLRAGRTQDALSTIVTAKGAGASIDAYGDALLSLIYLHGDSDQKAEDAMRDALLNDPDNLGVQTAQAFAALKRNKKSTMAKLIADLAKDQGFRADVNYFLMALADGQQRYGDARRYFEISVLAEPANPDVYIEQANFSIAIAQDPKMEAANKAQNYQEAQMYYKTALVARPEASDALVGLAVVALFQKNSAEAIRYAEAARDAEPNEAAGHFAAAAAYQAGGRLQEAQAENKKAGQIDPQNLEGREIPSAVALWRYLNTGGRMPVMSMPQ